MICAHTAQERAHYNNYSPYPSRSAGEARPGIVQRVCECSFGWIESDGYCYLPVTFLVVEILQFNHTQEEEKVLVKPHFLFLFFLFVSLCLVVWFIGYRCFWVFWNDLVVLFYFYDVFLVARYPSLPIHIPPPSPRVRNWVYLVMYGWPQQVGQASAAAVSRLCEAAVVNVPKKEVTNLSTQPRSWEFLEVHLSVVDRAALACWDVCLWVVCPVRGTFPPLVDSGAVCTTGPPRPSLTPPLGLRCAGNLTLNSLQIIQTLPIHVPL